MMDNLIDFSKYVTNCKKEIDQLLSSFSAKEPDSIVTAVSSGLWHKYDLPYIGMSDEDRFSYKQDGNQLDKYLGMYASIDADWQKEGRIILFHKSIREVANEYADAKQLSPESCFEDLFKIVLLHEIGHWIFHYAKIGSSLSNKFYKDITEELQEAIAQFFTKKSIAGNEQLLQLFNWLCSKQNQIYRNELPGDLEELIYLRKKIDLNYEIALRQGWVCFLDDENKSKDIPKITAESAQVMFEKDRFPKDLESYQVFVANHDSEIKKMKISNTSKKFGL